MKALIDGYDELSDVIELTYVNQSNRTAGAEGWYAWSYLVPSDYPTDPDATGNWQIVTQFHDQPNLAAGAYLCGSGLIGVLMGLGH